MRLMKKKEEDRETRKFWRSDENLKIEVSQVAYLQQASMLMIVCDSGRAQPYVPYDPTGRTGLDLAICQGILGTLLETCERLAHG
jgi:hypothetical protein